MQNPLATRIAGAAIHDISSRLINAMATMGGGPDLYWAVQEVTHDQVYTVSRLTAYGDACLWTVYAIRKAEERLSK